MSLNDPTIGDRNLERLLQVSYQPENPDPQFVAELQARLRATARVQSGEFRLRRVRTRMGWAMAAAAAVAAIGLYIYAKRPFPERPNTTVGPIVRGQDPEKRLANRELLTPKAKATAPKAETLEIGATAATANGEKRRLALPDGSFVYLNQNSSIRLEATRRLVLEQGEIFIEVSPKADDRFVVLAPDKQVVALGTKFAVRAAAGKSSVIVTQGKVKVSGLDAVLYAGQQLLPDAKKPSAAPRSTFLLDWARDLIAAASPLVPGSKYGAGALIAIDPSGQEAKITLRKFKLDIHIEDGFARTTIDQTYFNEETSQLEGTFHFPLPPDASLSRLAMYVNGDLMEGGMAERDHARNTFEQIRHTRRDPALLEWVDGSTFKMRVFPLEGRQEKRIVLSYTQRLPLAYGKATYRFPMGHSLQFVDQFAVNVRIKNGQLQQWASPTHALKSAPDGRDVLLSAETKNAKLERDLQLELIDSNASNRPTKFASSEHDGYRYLMFRHRPTIQQRTTDDGQPTKSHYLFLFESSADRDPLLARAQIEIIRTLLENLEHDDTFAILSANTRVRSIAEKQPATVESIQSAIEALEKVHLIGALDLDQALTATREVLKGEDGAWLVHVGSGVAAIGERREDVLTRRVPAGVHYAGIGVGKRWARSFMKAAAERSGGHFAQINPDEPVAWKAFDFLATLRLPRWQELRVTDDQKRTWLLHDSAIAAGEELCAVARQKLDEPIPQSVTVRGTLDGRAFEQKIAVEALDSGAGYLPRTWAKLEIDRLLAEDSTKNKPTIVELSKSMYVMSPFTSLLVLETEQMYKDFKVDRGRKDHWAMYPCEQKIPVVFEPVTGGARVGPPARPGSVESVLKSIIVRTGSGLGGVGGQVHVRGQTAWDHYTGTQVPLWSINPSAVYYYGSPRMMERLSERDRTLWFENPDVGLDLSWPTNYDFDRIEGLTKLRPTPMDELLVEHRLGELGLYPPARGLVITGESRKKLTAQAPFLSFRQPPNGIGGWGGGLGGGGIGGGIGGGFRGNDLGYGMGGNFGGLQGNFQGFGLGGQFGQMGFGGANGNWAYNNYFLTTPNGFNGQSNWSLGGFNGRIDNFGNPGGWQWQNGSATQLPPNGRFYNFAMDPRTVAFSADGSLRAIGNDWNGALRLWESGSFGEMLPWRVNMNGLGNADAIQALSNDLLKYKLASAVGADMPSLIYQRPALTDASRFLRDLCAFAPGMNTTEADIAAVLEAEAGVGRAKSGKIDAEARKLIEGARALTWHKVKFGDGARAFTVRYDGTGRFAFDRVLPVGLKEQVVCDGKTLWHLYPEIGLGAKRTFSRHHGAELRALLPWLLPPIEELARNSDVTRLASNIVAIVPHGKMKANLQVHLVFTDDGRLRERLVVAMPNKLVLSRERFDGKQLGEAAPAPELTPITEGLIVLPLPYRTLAHVEKAIGKKAPITPNLLKLSEDENLACLAAAFAQSTFNGNDAYSVPVMATLEEHFGLRHRDRAPGIHVLRQFALATPPYFTGNNPSALVRFLERVRQQSLGGKTNDDGGFIERLAALHNLSLEWNLGHTPDRRKAVLAQTRSFVERNRTVLGLAALLAVGVRGDLDQDGWRAQAEMWQLFDHDPEYGYAARYERMRCLQAGGMPNTARLAFDEMYRKALDAGALPPLDATVKQLVANENGPWHAPLLAAADQWTSKGRLSGVVALAWQCQLLGEPALAQQVFGRASAKLADAPVFTRLAAVNFLRQTGKPTEAQEILKPLLEHPKLSKLPQLWRLAAELALQRNQTRRLVEALERALDLEFAQLPEMVNLDAVRADYQALLNGYGQLLQALQQTETDPPADLTARIVKAADRWRALDPDPTQACQIAGRLLRQLEEDVLAWDYLTTPISLKPNEAAPLTALAQELANNNDLTLAEKAYAAAFAAEPTNAELLHARVQLLQRLGRTREARDGWKQLADGTWQPRFEWIRQQARQQVER